MTANMIPRAARAQLLATSKSRPFHRLPSLYTTKHRHFSASPSPRADFTHAIIGGGVVGLAIARALSLHPSSPSTLLLERHSAVGTETSSRNSEVIHAGIYYGSDSLKTKLCIKGKDQLYAFCEDQGVPFRRTGKWIVAQNDLQHEALQRIHDFCMNEIKVPVRWVSKEEARRREPEVRADKAILESPTTGIVDSHALMTALLGGFENAGGTLALESAVTGVRPLGENGSDGWEVEVRDSSGEISTITAETIINSAGLGAVDVHNMIVPADRKKKMFYAKGNYFSYPASSPKVNTLVYPAPEPGLGGLGTHLTLDMGGRIKFGPDVEWVDSADELSVNPARLPEAIEQIKKFIPNIDEKLLTPDYAGIRPKLAKAGAVALGKGFVDFYIRKEEGYHGWVNLLSIESPGLTSSLAIGDMVRDLLYSR